MHESVKCTLSEWIGTFGDVANKAVADVGAYNINGAVKDVIPHAVGFDLVAGPGVDVVLNLGEVPEEHRGRYDIVTSLGSFQCCPQPGSYKAEIVGLLKPGGHLFLTMCSPGCQARHTTSPGGFQDCLRFHPGELEDFMRPEIVSLACYVNSERIHPDLVFIGRLVLQ